MQRRPADQLARGSSKIIRPDAGRLASTDLSRTTKSVLLKSKATTSRGNEYIKQIRKSARSTWYISPLRLFDSPDGATSIKLSTVCEFFQIRNLPNASLEEAKFLHILYSHLASGARMLAAILPWSVERPLRALLAAMNARGKSYTKRSAKTRPLSCSPASLKKRSSGA
jgi:hypothetical protein